MTSVSTQNDLRHPASVTSFELLRGMIDISPDAISVKDSHLVYVACNAAFVRAAGKREEEIIGCTDSELYSQHQAELHRQGDRQVLETGEAVIREERVTGGDGERCFQVTKAPLRGANGAIMGVVALSQDITERKQDEVTGQLQADRYATLLSISHEGFLTMGTDGTLRDVNQAFCSLSGYSKEELLGMHINELYVGRKLEGTDRHIKQIVQQGFDRFETRYRKKDSTVIDVEISTSYWPTSGEFLLFCRDITERTRAEAERLRYEAELRKAQKLAERESQAKTRFLATASHDLRQPMQAMHLLAHLLVNHELPPESAEIAIRMQEAVDGLGEMLNALLDISKLDAGLVRPELSDFSLSELIRQLIDEHLPIAVEKGIRLKCVDSSLYVHSDLKLLTRILRNLISNAIKYTPSGKVLLGVRRKGKAAHIQVLDTGIGVMRNELKKVFDEFHQSGNTARDRREGLGLGLAIVKRLSTLLEHSVDVASHVGRGTCFSVTVPVALDAKERPRCLAKSQLVLELPYAGAEVLVVDDEADIREGLAMSLRQWGYAVSVAADFEQAISVMKKNSPAMVIADYRLGSKTGIDVIREVRRQSKRKIPALLLTGDATEERAREADRLGVQLVRKPVSCEQLRCAVVNGLGASY